MLVALAWDTHVHHDAANRWFDAHSGPWATCAVTEAGFVRVSSNPKVISGAVSVADARAVMSALRGSGEHRFLVNDVSQVDPDVPAATGHRQVTDSLLIAVAKRSGMQLLTFDAGVAAMAESDVTLLRR